MIYSGRPIEVKAYPGTEVARVVEGCGVVVEPERVDVFADAIVKSAGDQGMRERFCAAARRYAESNLDKEAVLRRFEAQLVELDGKSR